VPVILLVFHEADSYPHDEFLWGAAIWILRDLHLQSIHPPCKLPLRRHHNVDAFMARLENLAAYIVEVRSCLKAEDMKVTHPFVPAKAEHKTMRLHERADQRAFTPRLITVTGPVTVIWQASLVFKGWSSA